MLRSEMDIPPHSSVSNKMEPPPSNVVPLPPSRNMRPPPPPHLSMPPPPPHMSMPPPPPPKLSSSKLLSEKQGMSLFSPEPMAPPRSLNIRSVSPLKLCAQIPPKEPDNGKPKVAPVSETLLKLMDYGDDDDDDDIDTNDILPQGNSVQ